MAHQQRYLAAAGPPNAVHRFNQRQPGDAFPVHFQNNIARQDARRLGRRPGDGRNHRQLPVLGKRNLRADALKIAPVALLVPVVLFGA